MLKRVVVTGLGPVNARTAGWEPLWKLFLCASQEGEAIGGPVAKYEPRPAPHTASRSQFRQADALARLALQAVDLAVADSELDLSELEPEDVGIAFGTGYGCLAANVEYLQGVLQRGSRLGNPVVFQNTVPNAATGYVSVAQGLRGPTATFSSGATAGLLALDFAYQQIAEGHVQTMIVVSADCVCPQLEDDFAARGHLSPSRVPRPFDIERDGTVLSAGACALVLEEYATARRRGAIMYEEILATGFGSDPGEDSARALANAVEDALHRAAATPEEIGAVFSGASGSVDADVWESRGLWKAMGEHAGRVPVTCPKSVMGETLGNAGTFGVLLAALTLGSGWLAGTAHHGRLDPRCPLNVQAGGRQVQPQLALVPVLGEDQTAAAVVLRRCA
jgi:3-oxoacyl-(acyl-carrier-protein) synthase